MGDSILGIECGLRDDRVRGDGARPPTAAQEIALIAADYARLSGRFLLTGLPRVGGELDRRWVPRALAIPDQVLRGQAIESISTKRFHCEGGAVYTAGLPRSGPALAAIVALQTISDYLDSVCDRGSSTSGADFRQLHRAMVDAVALEPPTGCYYRLHPDHEDDGYLAALVDRCRRALRRIPGYPAVAEQVVWFARRYSELQEYKHLRPKPVGEAALQRWYEPYRQADLSWWEFAAASGSTLGMFALIRRAAFGTLTKHEVDTLRQAYFPAICSLHILLDYFIDQGEDSDHGEINLVSYYQDDHQRLGRVIHFVERARKAARSLPDASFHQWVVGGLPGLYLADPKVRRQRLGTAPILRAGGLWSQIVYQLTRVRNLTHR